MENIILLEKKKAKLICPYPRVVIWTKLISANYCDCGWYAALKECSTNNSLTSGNSYTFVPKRKKKKTVDEWAQHSGHCYYSGFKSCAFDLDVSKLE